MVKLKTEDVIKSTVINSIKKYATKKVKAKRKFQILDLLIPRERKVRSIVGGLETSLGTTLWEPLGRALAENNGFKVHKGKLKQPAHMPGNLAAILSTVIEGRIQNNGVYDGSTAHAAIKQACSPFIQNPLPNFTNPPRGLGVDIWLEKDGINYFFDTKTVQPNLANFRSFLSQVLTWYAYFYAQNPQGQAEGRIVFPYNPNPGENFWQKAMGRGRPLEPETEGWVEDRFWNFCSGEENTYAMITACFREIAETGELENELEKILNS